MRVNVNGNQVCEIKRNEVPVKVMRMQDINPISYKQDKILRQDVKDFSARLETIVSEMEMASAIDRPSKIKKFRNFLKTSQFSIAPIVPMLATVTFQMDRDGIFWNTFLQYIFPWMLDIAKVYCLIRIAQAFYQEKRGGRDSGTGWSALLEHGKWYLIFWMLPIGVELIDAIGHKMFEDMSSSGVTNIK